MATIYKRGQTWWARAQRKGKEYRQSLETRDKGTAKRRLDIWLEQLDAQSWGDRPRVAFATAVKHFMVEYLPTLKPSSAARYSVSLEWLAESFDGKTLDEIGREEMSSFESWRRAMGRSNPTIRRDLACLSSVFTFCEDREWIDDGKNPVPAFMRRRAKRGLIESPARKRYLTEADEKLLLANATPAVCRAIQLAIGTGLRRGEMFSLTWPQIDFNGGMIFTTTDTKNHHSRVVPLPPRSAQILAQIRAQQNAAEIATFNVFAHLKGSRQRDKNGKMRGRRPGEPINDMAKGFRGAVRRAKLVDLEWHDLRRTAGCRWLQRDKRSMAEVSNLLGHSSVLVTEQRYAFLERETVAREVAAQNPAQGRTD